MVSLMRPHHRTLGPVRWGQRSRCRNSPRCAPAFPSGPRQAPGGRHGESRPARCTHTGRSRKHREPGPHGKGLSWERFSRRTVSAAVRKSMGTGWHGAGSAAGCSRVPGGGLGSGCMVPLAVPVSPLALLSLGVQPEVGGSELLQLPGSVQGLPGGDPVGCRVLEVVYVGAALQRAELCWSR